jgi:glycosyltransferase involved in cell wall biosynthesis
MFLVFTIDSIGRGGKERAMAILTAGLITRNYQIKIFAKRIGDEGDYVKEYNIDRDSIEIYNGFRQFRQLVKENRPDIVVSWDAITSFYNLFLYRFYNYKFINGSIRHGIRLRNFTHLFRSIICYLSPCLIANSLAGLKANNLIPGKRRFVLYNGTESKFTNQLTEFDIESLKMRLIPGYSINPGFVFITVANFVPYKDYFTVFKALKKVKDKFVFYYLLIGDGPMRKEIEMIIKECDLEKNVILIGRTENITDYLFAADLMIHSSRGEGISNAILEGMYAGLPVIAANVGGVPETIYPGSSMLFPYKNHEALYSCLLKSKELNESLDVGSEKYQTHLRKFSVETMVRRFEEIVNTVISDR